MKKNMRKRYGREQAAACLKNFFLPLVLVFVLLACALWIYGEASSNYSWQWPRVWRYLGVWAEDGFKPGILLHGLGITVLLSLCSMGLAVFFAAVLALMRLGRSPVLSLAAGVLISVIRNTPLLIQLFLFYFVVSAVLHLNPFVTAVFCLALFEGVYLAEIIRGGIAALPHTQWEASFSLGMGLGKTLHYVIFPQVFRNILPSLTGQLISLIKDTSLVSAIAVADLTLQARNVIAETYLSFEIWIVTACLYFLLTLAVSVPGFLLARRYGRRRHSVK